MTYDILKKIFSYPADLHTITFQFEVCDWLKNAVGLNEYFENLSIERKSLLLKYLYELDWKISRELKTELEINRIENKEALKEYCDMLLTKLYFIYNNLTELIKYRSIPIPDDVTLDEFILAKAGRPRQDDYNLITIESVIIFYAASIKRIIDIVEIENNVSLSTLPEKILDNLAIKIIYIHFSKIREYLQTHLKECNINISPKILATAVSSITGGEPSHVQTLLSDVTSLELGRPHPHYADKNIKEAIRQLQRDGFGIGKLPQSLNKPNKK